MRVLPSALCLLAGALLARALQSGPQACNDTTSVTFNGLYKDQVEAFLGIPYAQDTGAQHRFKPPRPYSSADGTSVVAQSPGPACPQELGAQLLPLYLGNITDISEDCLRLNVNRPNGTQAGAKLPVMVYIHGGSFYSSSKDDPTAQPGGLILESIANGHPVIHVAMNYRLGVFGFAASEALSQEGSLNAGLLDQRLALDWVKANIATFGGDPTNITIHGQSSGGLAMGLQTLAYGGAKPAPFHRVICQSQALEPGITGDFTKKAMAKLTGAAGCNTTALESNATIACLRALSLDALLKAQIETHSDGPEANIGDEWLPVVDGTFLPTAPSVLLDEGRFANVSAMIGWCEDDTNPFVSTDISSDNDTRSFFSQYVPGMTNDSLNGLLDLYPVSDFQANPAANLSAEFYRSGHLLRDILMVCQPMFFGQHVHAKTEKDVYLYDQNQTILTPILESLGSPGLGVVHTSEFAYMFGNLSHYDIYDFPFEPNETDYSLARHESRSWSSFAATGHPSLRHHATLQDWQPAFERHEKTSVYVIGGDNAGLSALEGPRSKSAVVAQKLQERCAYLNSPEIVKQLQY